MSIDQNRQPANSGVISGEYAVTPRPQTGPDLLPVTSVADIDAVVIRARTTSDQARDAEQAAQTAYVTASTASLKVNDEAHLIRGKVPAELHARKTAAARATVLARAERDDAKTHAALADAAHVTAVSCYPWTGTDVPTVELSGGALRPVTVGDSGTYGFYRPPATRFDREGDDVVQVAELIDGAWHGTPARYSAGEFAFHSPEARLAIDYGNNWYLPDETSPGSSHSPRTERFCDH